MRTAVFPPSVKAAARAYSGSCTPSDGAVRAANPDICTGPGSVMMLLAKPALNLCDELVSVIEASPPAGCRLQSNRKRPYTAPGGQMELTDGYFDSVITLMERLRTEERDSIDRAATAVADTI